MSTAPTADQTEPTAPQRRASGLRIEPYLFLVVEGARLDAGGLRLALRDTTSLVIGRGPARSVRGDGDGARALEVADTRMSSVHARVLRDGIAFRIDDAGSTNGTVVNGEVVSSCALRDGDVIELGQTVFLFREIEQGAGTPVGDLVLDPGAAGPSLAGFATLDPELSRRASRLALLAPTPISILLLGETGTGKEVLARSIHALSRRPGPFVAVNCGAMPANLVESHLFGHVRGAFSGAVRDEPGVVRSAQFGTLLLDEIGDLPASAQATLLRVLQEGEVVPVGSAHPTHVDVRVLAATHKPLEELFDRGEFRGDLYARLAGYTFALAPLRDRRVDLGLLIASLLASGAIGARPGLRLHRRAARAMILHDWPMNVRELSQALRAATVLAEEGLIRVEDLPGPVAASLTAAEPAPDDDDGARDEQLRRELLVRLADAKGNVSEVARAMGKARQQVQRWMRRFAIEPSAYRGR